MITLKKYTEQTYVALRVISGATFSFHGLQKVFDVLANHQPSVGSQVWFGGVIELVTGILLIIGFKTRWAAFLASGTMAVAYIQFHWKFQWSANFFPAINRGELALIYCFLFLYIACRGAGIWAIDKES